MRGRPTDRHRQTRQREIDRQTDRQTEREIDRQTDRQRRRKRESKGKIPFDQTNNLLSP